MALHRRDLLLAGGAGFIAWGLLVHWLPILRYLGYALGLGAALSSTGLIALLLLTTRNRIENPNYSVRASTAFIKPENWRKELVNVRKFTRYRPRPLYPQSFVVSEGIDDLLSFVTRDFVSSWYHNISPSPTFANEIDRVIRVALENLRDRLLTEDLISLIVSRIFPILTSHLKEFDIAERSVRGKNLSRNVTESEELDLAIAYKFREGRLHPAVGLSAADQKGLQQEYLRKIATRLLPQLFPESVIKSRIVSVLIREIVSCAVLLPLATALSDPDTWNQLMEAYGRTALQDRKTVRKLRAALDEHASPAPKSKHRQSFPKLSAHDSERAFERFVRTIRRCNNLSDARRFRALITSQLKRESMVEGQDPVYLKRLETGKRVLDQKVAKLSAPGKESLIPPVAASHVRHGSSSTAHESSLVDVLHSASGLSYFMEFMDRQKLMSLVQYWIVVDGVRNPLEDDFGEDTASGSMTWTTADRNDLALLSQTYLTKSELKVTEESRRAVKAFLSAGKRATPEQYRKARTVVLTTQSSVLERMESDYYPKFKESDLYWKYLASDEASTSQAPERAPSPPAAPAEPRERRPLPPIMARTASQPASKSSKDLRRAAVSSSDVKGMGRLFDDDDSPRRSIDSERSLPLFDDDYDIDQLAMSTQSLGKDSQNGDNDVAQSHVLETMEAALNDIIINEPTNTGSDDLRDSEATPALLGIDNPEVVTRRSSDTPRVEGRMNDKTKKSIASLGLVDHASRLGVFDDDLFPDQQKFIEDEYEEPVGAEEKDPADEVHEAAPGDLGLTEAIEVLTTDIDKLTAQDSVVEALMRKAELTNNMAELRILRKSKASIEREIHRKEMQRQQYIIQESDNSLYGRSTVRIKSLMVGKEEDGREFAMYVIEVRRNAGEQMPAASWAVPRRYSEFHELHQKLRMSYPSVRHLEFPRRRVVMKLQKEFLQKRRQALELYLQKLLLLPEVCRSRDLRAFLSQRAILSHPEAGSRNSDADTKDLVTRIYNSVADGMDDFLGNFGVLDQLSTAGQNLISAATSQANSNNTLAAHDPLLATEDAVTSAEAEAELNAYEDRELEPFIKPVCDLFLEAFELNRGNNWLRGRAVVVVLHQLLGGTIERKVRDGARSLLQEDSLMRYVNLAKENLWPDGVLRKFLPRSVADRHKSRTEATVVLATLIPDLAGNVVGRANAQAAARRIFATLNNKPLNTHLAFTLLDEIILALFGSREPGRSR